MYGMILAAGLGTRLGALSGERPKPLLPVCNWPLVRWAAALCLHHGVDDLVVNLHHMGPAIETELGDGRELGARVSYSREPVILGTGGGVRQMAQGRPRQTVLVVNGKIVTDVALDQVIALHRRSQALATMVLCPTDEPERWGAIGVDDEGQLIRLLDQRRRGGRAAGDFMFTGIHLLEPELIDAIPPGPGPSCIIRTAYGELFRRGARLAGYVHRGYFQEHSTPRRYLEGNFKLLDRRECPPAGPPLCRGVDPHARIDGDATIVEPVLVGAQARIEAGARVGPHVVIGPGARVGRGVTIARCVVWPGAVVGRSCQDSIITPRQALQLASPEEPPG
jgi:NDP-sugar pyrophosphorylase family protein